MRLTSSQKDLHFALDTVSLAVNSATTLPVLNNILLKVSGKKLFLSATNLEIAINYAIDATVKNEGAITVPAKLLTNYISFLKDGEVELRVDDGTTLHLKSKSSQTKIKGISPDEFPLIPKVEKEVSMDISTKELLEAVEATVFSASTSTTRPVLAGVYMQAEKDMLTMVATDSFRLAEKKTKLEKPVEKMIECIIPVKTLLELSRILSSIDGKERVEVQISKNQILFMVAGVELVSRLIEGKFPDYEKIIPRASRTKIEINPGDLALATKRVSLFAKENNNSIKLNATTEGKLEIATDETSLGEEKAELDVKIEGDSNKVAINSQYLLDILARIKEPVSLEMDEKLTPIVVRPAKKGNYLYIIMPLKV